MGVALHTEFGPWWWGGIASPPPVNQPSALPVLIPVKRTVHPRAVECMALPNVEDQTCILVLALFCQTCPEPVVHIFTCMLWCAVVTWVVDYDVATANTLGLCALLI